MCTITLDAIDVEWRWVSFPVSFLDDVALVDADDEAGHCRCEVDEMLGRPCVIKHVVRGTE